MKKLFATFLLLGLLSTAYSTVYTVNSNADAATGAGTTGTLRWCIQQVNANAATGPHSITFAIATGPQVLTLGSPYPAITNIVGGLTIDGFSQPGWTLNPIIEIRGPGYGVGFDITNSPGTLLQGLVIRGFGDPYVNLTSCAGAIVRGCWFGMDLSGASGFGTGYAYAIRVTSSAGCSFGGNLISNPSYKIVVATMGGAVQLNTNSTACIIRGIYSGTNVAGTAIAANGNNSHIEVNATCNTTLIGGITNGDANVLGRTTGGSGIFLKSNSNIVTGNLIGLGSNGTTNMAIQNQGIYIQNSLSNSIQYNAVCNAGQYGILVENGGSNPCRYNLIDNNLIGVNITGITAAPNTNTGVRLRGVNQTRITNNVISGNGDNGVYFENACDSNLVSGNKIGLGFDGTTVLVNGANNSHHGIYVASSGSDRNSFKSNIIVSPNRGSAIKLDYGGYDTIAYNYLGVNVTGLTLVGIGTDNTNHGIAIQNNVSNMEITGNVICGAKGDGIRADGTCSNYLIRGNIIGLNKDGLGTTFGNDGTGIYFAGGSNKTNITIGGSTVAARNIVSMNGKNVLYACGDTKGYGIILEQTNGGYIRGNYIGVNITGNVAAGNGGSGIMLNGGCNNIYIGGTGAGEGNVVCDNGRYCSGTPGNVRHGVQFVSNGGATNMQVQGNYIGLGADGSTMLGNAEEGVSSWQTPNITIGGATAAHRNYIAGNNKGVFLQPGSAINCVVQGNYIGTDITGTIAKPNYVGVHIANGSNNNLIGGPNAGEGNLISANTFSGILLEDGDNNTIQRNLIGVTPTLGPLGNGTNGITIRAAGAQGSTQNLIGSPTNTNLANIIAFNTSNGIFVNDAASIRNQIRRNSIYCNGTARVNGINLNGAGNINLSSPGPLVVPTYITAPSPGIQLANTPAGDIATTDVVEVFYDDACGTCQGRTYLGNASNSGTQWSFSPLPAGADCSPKGVAGCLSGVKNITATRTDNNGNTSEFMDCDPVALPVELVYFDARKHPEGVFLNWITISEENNAYFELLRSNDGASYNPIAKVIGRGTTVEIQNYSWLDKDVHSGTYYYMLMQHDRDGKSTIVGVQTITILEEVSALVYPTVVARGENVHIEVSTQSELIYLELLDTDGRVLNKKEIITNTSLNLTYPCGMYFLKIRENTAEKVVKVIIQ